MEMPTRQLYETLDSLRQNRKGLAEIAYAFSERVAGRLKKFEAVNPSMFCLQLAFAMYEVNDAYLTGRAGITDIVETPSTRTQLPSSLQDALSSSLLAVLEPVAHDFVARVDELRRMARQDPVAYFRTAVIEGAY